MEITYFNNADYEQFLFSGKDQYQFQFSKTNKEFEYFILITEDAPLYTDSQYSESYMSKLKELFHKEIKYTTSKAHLTPWCMPLETEKTLVSKQTAMKSSQTVMTSTQP